MIHLPDFIVSPVSRGTRITANGVREYMRRRGLFLECFCGLVSDDPRPSQIVDTMVSGHTIGFCHYNPARCGYRGKFSLVNLLMVKYDLTFYLVDLTTIHQGGFLEFDYPLPSLGMLTMSVSPPSIQLNLWMEYSLGACSRFCSSCP